MPAVPMVCSIPLFAKILLLSSLLQKAEHFMFGEKMQIIVSPTYQIPSKMGLMLCLARPFTRLIVMLLRPWPIGLTLSSSWDCTMVSILYLYLGEVLYSTSFEYLTLILILFTFVIILFCPPTGGIRFWEPMVSSHSFIRSMRSELHS